MHISGTYPGTNKFVEQENVKKNFATSRKAHPKGRKPPWASLRYLFQIIGLHCPFYRVIVP